MNPIFWILVVLALVALWFLLNFTFRKIGKFFIKVYYKTKKNLGIAAQAEAEANAKIAASLTPELIEKIKYEQWNGQMPSTMAGTDSSILITP